MKRCEKITYLEVVKEEFVPVVSQSTELYSMALKNNDLKGLIPTTHLKLQESLSPHPHRNNVFMQMIHEFVIETKPYISYVPVDSNGTYVDYSNNEPHKRHQVLCCCLNEFAEQCTEDKRYDRISDIDQNKDNLSDKLDHEWKEFKLLLSNQSSEIDDFDENMLFILFLDFMSNAMLSFKGATSQKFWNLMYGAMRLARKFPKIPVEQLFRKITRQEIME
ncbi:MAG: hypothetical protein EZS28_027770 [Streblomastix strix]|uniref:Uncharacterized protein n=1 Tax=Streblomastix strix TaxID=222440 RepID=A0A5J4V2N1_9EUKA|nr:MAG: hypothetical protein EZS28_027770 [Streblomastix strix]